jgi:integrase/recombinase XerD
MLFYIKFLFNDNSVPESLLNFDTSSKEDIQKVPKEPHTLDRMIYSVSHLSEIIAVILDIPGVTLSKRARSPAVIVRWCIEIILDTEESMDLTELIEAFFVAKQRTFASNTRRAYRYDLMACAQVLPTLPVREITVSHLRLFLDASTDLAPTTLARRKAALRSCFRWAYQQDLVPADPTAKLEAIAIGERDPRPLTEKQVEAMLAAIPRKALRNRLLFTLLYETGMRVGEAMGLQVQHVHLNDLDGGYLRIVGKGNKERVIPLIDASHSVALLRKLLKTVGGVGPLFRGDVHKGGRYGEALDYSTIWYHFERYVEQARFAHSEHFATEQEPITIHRLRHTYATIKLRDGVSLPSVRKLLGHKNLQTTLRYTEFDLETIKRELVEARQRKR